MSDANDPVQAILFAIALGMGLGALAFFVWLIQQLAVALSGGTPL